MKENNLEKAIDEIENKLPKNKKIIKYYEREPHLNEIVGGYFFQEKEKNINFSKKIHKFFFPIHFHKKYDKPLLKLGEIGVFAEYIPFYGIEILDKENSQIKKICKEISKKYNLQLKNRNL
jgi:hypothetical protein